MWKRGEHGVQIVNRIPDDLRDKVKDLNIKRVNGFKRQFREKVAWI